MTLAGVFLILKHMLLDATLLAPDSSGRLRAYVVGATIRVRTNCGDGKLCYLTQDRYAGVKLDGERACIEVPLEQIGAVQ